MSSHILKLQKIRENVAEAHRSLADLTDEGSDVEDNVVAHRTAIQEALVLLTDEARRRRLYSSPSVLAPCIDKRPYGTDVTDQQAPHCPGIVEPVDKQATLLPAPYPPPIIAPLSDEDSVEYPLRNNSFAARHNRKSVVSPPPVTPSPPVSSDVLNGEEDLSPAVQHSDDNGIDEDEGGGQVDEEVVDEDALREDLDVDEQILATLFSEDQEEQAEPRSDNDNDGEDEREESIVDNVAVSICAYFIFV